MRHLFLTGVLAMLGISSAMAYTIPNTNAPRGSEVYIVTFKEPGAFHYTGEVSGLNNTADVFAQKSRNRAADPDIQAYRDHVNTRLNAYADEMATAFSRAVEPVLRYNVLRTGMAVLLTAEEAQRVAGMQGVTEVRKDVMYELDTDVGPQWIGADHIWDGSAAPGGTPNFGAGTIVGIFDSGINMDHPSFSDAPEDTHDFVNPFGDGNFVGSCDTNPGTYVCNNKLIGAWDFADPFGEPGGPDGPEDNNGHGTHTASTAAGNFISGPFLGGNFAAPSMSGVARHANVIAYDVCTGGCPGAATAGAQEQAILDGVDVINFSIGPTAGGGSPWAPSDSDRGFLDVVGAGILVSASAGNNGPTPGLVSHLGPWMQTVANLTHNRSNQNAVSVAGAPASLQDMWGQLGVEDNFGGSDVIDEAIWAGDVDPANFEGCNAWAGTPFTGAIALISRGGCSFEDKIVNGEAAGAVAVIIFNHLSDIPFAMGGIEPANIPSLMIGLTDGQTMRDYIIGNPLPTVTMSATSVYTIDDTFGSWANSGTSRGPSQVDTVTKPDLAGPGTNIFAAYADQIGPPPQYSFLSGTSMSSPHAAGAAALMIAMYPDWTPAQVKSALMMTAFAGLDEAGLASNPDIEGTGTIDLEKAAKAGLVMDENFDNYLAANPSTGGDPKTLNIPSVRDPDCNGVCSWTRTVCSALDVSTSWTVNTPGGSDFDVTATPSSFNLAPSGQMIQGGFEDAGASSSCQSVEIEMRILDQQLVNDGVFIFERVRFEEDTAQAPFQVITTAVLPTGVDN